MLCQAPFDVPDDAVHVAALQEWAWALAQGARVPLPFAPPNRLPRLGFGFGLGLGLGLGLRVRGSG